MEIMLVTAEPATKRSLWLF